MADQQYCLRWNNHQPTLAGCFDRMLKDDQFTDCTLSAEGVNIVAHRMLLSACSPYFNELFKEYNKQQFPIVILRDVSVVELKALMDYMYRGEVNISQDQLADLLKVAEMLQIKGLYEAGFSESRASAPAPSAPRVSTGTAVARPQPLDLPPDITSDGAASPAPRRRKRARRRSSSDDFPTTIDVAAEPIGQAVAPAAVQAEPVNNVASESVLPVPPKLEEHQFDVVLPKEEYVDDQDSIENITLDDDDMDEMDQAGPSHGDGSSQGYPPSWHQSDRSTEDLFLSAQDSINNAGGAQRDSQGLVISEDEVIANPVQVLVKEEPHDEAPAEKRQRVSISGTSLDGIKPYSNISDIPGLGDKVPMVCLNRVDLPVRTSARLSARKSIPNLQSTNQAEEDRFPNIAAQPPTTSRIFMEPPPDMQDLSEPVTAKSPNALEHPSATLLSAGLRRYQLILPKPTTPATATERNRKSKAAPKQRPKSHDRTVMKPPSTTLQTELPSSTTVPRPSPQTKILPHPSPPIMILPQPPPPTMVIPDPPAPTIMMQQTSQMIIQQQPTQTMMIAPPMFVTQPPPTTIMMAHTTPPTMIMSQAPPPPTSMMMSHLAVVSSTPKPKNVKWPLPPKQAASSAPRVNVASVSSTPSVVNCEPDIMGSANAKQLKRLAAIKARHKPVGGSTPKGQGAVSKEVGRPVTNGYQCCFCNDLVGTMSELMMHLRTCPGLAAAKM